MNIIQHQIYRLRQEMEKNAADNNEFKNLIKKKLSWGKRNGNTLWKNYHSQKRKLMS